MESHDHQYRGQTQGEEREYLIPKTIKLAVEDKQLIDAGEPLAAGSLDIKEILSIKGLRAAQEYWLMKFKKSMKARGFLSTTSILKLLPGR